MDDRNGDTFDRHDELFGQLNASDSEQECLREFLLDSVDESRNVPYGKPSSGGFNNLVNNYTDANIFPRSSLENNNAFENHVVKTEGTEFPINCEELTFQPSVSNMNSMEMVKPEGKLVNGEVLGMKIVDDLNVVFGEELLRSDLVGKAMRLDENNVDLTDDLLHSAMNVKIGNDLSTADTIKDFKTVNKSAESPAVSLPSDSDGETKDDKLHREDKSRVILKAEEGEPSRRTDSTPEASSASTVQTSPRGDQAPSQGTKCADVSDLPVSIHPKPAAAASGSGPRTSVDLDLGNGQAKVKKKVETRGRKRKVPGAALAMKPPVKKSGAGRGRPPGPAKKKLGGGVGGNLPAKAAKARAQPPVTYQSQISPDQNGIKLYIKKSCTAAVLPKTVKKRRKKSKRDEGEQGGEQSVWGERIPMVALETIFMMGTLEEGSFPYLLRVGLVCRLWNTAAARPSLWHSVDLSNCKKVKNLPMISWLLDHRLSRVQDLNLTGCKVSDIRAVVQRITANCKHLRGINLTAWSGLTGDHMRDLTEGCPLLARLDLSSIGPESNQSKSAVCVQSVTALAETVGSRLTHLLLANNKVNGFPQIITALATHCPNLQVLDVSNVRTMARTTASLHIERLQEGCPLLRVLRITNSEVALSATPLQEQAASPGFPLLEELSVATVTNSSSGLSSTPIIDDSSIERILKTSHKLRLLDVRGCTRITDSSLVRVPAWDLEHLFLAGCQVTRMNGSGLELIAQKWCHSLVEMDLAWSSATESLDAAVAALAECDSSSHLRVLNLCGSSVSLAPVQKVLRRCPQLASLNLASCRALPRGIKRLYEGAREVDELRASFDRPPAPPPAEQGGGGDAEPAGGEAADDE